MRFVLTVGIYLAYIRTFCEYLLTGNVVAPFPLNPAGMLAHAGPLDQIIARPDGVFLCVLFAVACYGLVSWVEEVGSQITANLVRVQTLDQSYRSMPETSGTLNGLGSTPKSAKDGTNSTASTTDQRSHP